MFTRQPGSHNVLPQVIFDGCHGVILFDDSVEHRLFNPTLEAMLRRYLAHPESRAGAREWLNGTEPFSPFGFVTLCEYLDLDADYVRRGLTQWMNDVDNAPSATTRSNDRQSHQSQFRVPNVTRAPFVR
jgi:hypothetical protein